MVKVSCMLLVLPVCTVPKLRLDGLGVKAPAVTALPDSVHVMGVAEAVDVRLTVPEALPAACGANVTVKLALWPAATVAGVVRPLSVNPAPVMDN